MRDYIESLFLGTGPLVSSDGVIGCTSSQNWGSFPTGTNVELIVSSTVPPVSVTALTDTAALVPWVTAGAISVSVSSTDNANPIPAANQVTVTMHSNPLSVGCTYPQGCTFVSYTFVSPATAIVSARAVLASGQFPGAFVHDALGHGLGLCHVDGNRIGGAGLSLMSYGPGVFSNQLPSQYSAYDALALQSVYQSGMQRGARRPDFLQFGLVNPMNVAIVPSIDRPAREFVVEISAPRIR